MSFLSGLTLRGGGEVRDIFERDECAGVLCAFGPHRYPVNISRVVLQLGRSLWDSRKTRVPLRSCWLGFQLLKHFEKAHPREPHWYVLAIGIDPKFQRKRYGERLLHPLLAEADRDRVAVYLESANTRNLPFYERLGFEVISEDKPFPECPKIVRMLRKPAK